MAGLFDDFTKPVESNPAKVRKALEAQQAQVLSNFSAPAAGRHKDVQHARDLVAGMTGLAQAGAFGETAQEHMGVENEPELVEAKANAALVKSIQELEGDPSSADFAKRAAVLAKDAGRPDLALRFTNAFGTRTKAEAAATAATALAQSKEERAKFSALPTSAQEEIVGLQPQFLVDTLGMSSEEAAQVSAQVAERNEFQRQKLKKSLEDVNKATTTKTTNADVNQIKATLSMFGVTGSSFGFGDNTEEFDGFATPIAAEVQRRMDVLKDRGDRGDRNVITNEVMQELNDSGAFVLEPQFFGDGVNVKELDPGKFANVFTGQDEIIDLSL